MESSIKCVFCNSKSTNDKLVAFTVHTLKKCREVLDIRKKFNLKYKDVILPASECDDGYHIKCHKLFLAVMKKYYEKKALTSSDISVQTDEPTPSTSSAHEIEQTHQEGQSAIQEASGEKLTEAALSVAQDICAFCNKKYKKFKGRQAPLVRGEKKILIEALAEYLDVVRDSELFKSLSNEPPHLFYHKICRVEYFNNLKKIKRQPV
ncbi:uncharacterized protein LOC129246191 [Anastrepha obliqua]|uniref:uncharacterized protein LOC129246191 n=1 Tax=Anastrepha obliqua TaxID=95512 RepID=UPI002409BDD5|nr:uncharacterized protein LOC129246191 [Anastrepha obliqua]